LCSGHGDWAAHKAKTNPDTNWVTVELMVDRVYSGWTKAVMDGVLEKTQNLVCVGGDASTFVSSRDLTPDQCADSIYINYPEPSPFDGDEDCLIDGESETHWEIKPSSRSLLRTNFLLQCHRILKDKGTISILTDNKDFAVRVAAQFEIMQDFFEADLPADPAPAIAPTPATPAAASSTTVTTTTTAAASSSASSSAFNPSLRTKKPKTALPIPPAPQPRYITTAVPKEYTGSGSFFDRLWKNGGFDDRYFLNFVKK